MADHFDLLMIGFDEAISQMRHDPLMECFSERIESKKFMLNLCEEIISNSLYGKHDMAMRDLLTKAEQISKTSASSVRKVTFADGIREEQTSKLLAEKKFMERQITELQIELNMVKTTNESLSKKVSQIPKESSLSTMVRNEMENTSRNSDMDMIHSSDVIIRDNKKLTEEIEYMRMKNLELQKRLQSQKHTDNVSSLPEVMEVNRHLKERSEAQDKKLDELDLYVKSQESHILTLKNELNSYSETNSNLKRDLHRIEVEMLECRNKLKEEDTVSQHHRDCLVKAEEEITGLTKELEVVEKDLKLERRRSTGFETELEKMKYTHELMHKNITQELKSLRDQNIAIKTENKALTERLDCQLKEYLLKLDEEKKKTSKSIKIIKDAESRNEALKVLADSLQQKVDFFKHHVTLMDDQERTDKARDEDMPSKLYISPSTSIICKESIDTSKTVKLTKDKLILKLRSLENCVKDMRLAYRQEMAEWTSDVKAFKLEVASMVYRLRMNIANRLIEQNNKIKKISENKSVQKMNYPAREKDWSRPELKAPLFDNIDRDYGIIKYSKDMIMTPASKPKSHFDIKSCTNNISRRDHDKRHPETEVRKPLFREFWNKENNPPLQTEVLRDRDLNICPSPRKRPLLDISHTPHKPQLRMYGMDHRPITHIDAIEVDSQAILDCVNDYRPRSHASKHASVNMSTSALY